MGAAKKSRARARLIKGKAKKHVGRATGNDRLRMEGKADEVIGNLKAAGEKVKDAFRR
jgi:uncharacterized protein YjbJ (UPF0337 family)